MFGVLLATAATLSAPPPPETLHDQRFYAEPFATDAQHGEADPYDYATSRPPWIRFDRPGVMTIEFGLERETHRFRARREGDHFIITLYSTSGGDEIKERFTWRWLDDGRAETDLLEVGGPHRMSVMARLDEDAEAVFDRHAYKLALEHLKAMAGTWIDNHDEKLELRPDGTARLKGETLSVRMYRARFECDGPETIEIRLLRGQKRVLELAVLDAHELVEAGAPGDLCLYVAVHRKPNWRKWIGPNP